MSDHETRRHFRYIVRVLSGTPEARLPKALAGIFERHLRSVPPTSILGPYHPLYRECWEKLAAGRPLSQRDAQDAASLLIVMYSVMRSTGRQGAEW